MADDLALLNGPITGVVTLPRHLDWSGAADYDLDAPGRMVDLYRTVLIEATKPADLHDFLDRETLARLWRALWLPPDLRRAWEERYFLDIDAVLASGRYSGDQLLRLAEAADPGFDRAMFADVLGAMDQISDAAFAAYGVDAPAIERLRERFAAWRVELRPE
ncbi:hypothetical protein ACFQS1_22670 [Paractinoplanes rhizophilus]|uniref:Uncharacterized protein n=1 Tax=Paractinoplanes rhizophilus TaxID=1416877 RepID=A0ABW2HUE9_9ACTN